MELFALLGIFWFIDALVGPGESYKEFNSKQIALNCKRNKKGRR